MKLNIKTKFWNSFFYFASAEVHQLGGKEISFFQKERTLWNL